MKDVYITSIQRGGSGGDMVPTETFSLNFRAVKVEYQEESGINRWKLRDGKPVHFNAGTTQRVAVGDLNGDGKADIVQTQDVNGDGRPDIIAAFAGNTSTGAYGFVSLNPLVPHYSPDDPPPPPDQPRITQWVDADADGMPEAWQISYPNGMNIWHSDANENGYAEMLLLDLNGDGTHDAATLDADENGLAEQLWMDANGDGLRQDEEVRELEWL
jgi:hypothetical protein